jgi:hypothetical protein
MGMGSRSDSRSSNRYPGWPIRVLHSYRVVLRVVVELALQLPLLDVLWVRGMVVGVGDLLDAVSSCRSPCCARLDDAPQVDADGGALVRLKEEPAHKQHIFSSGRLYHFHSVEERTVYCYVPMAGGSTMRGQLTDHSALDALTALTQIGVAGTCFSHDLQTRYTNEDLSLKLSHLTNRGSGFRGVGRTPRERRLGSGWGEAG